MTNQELIDYYANLLILQYRQKPNAYAMIQTLVKPVIMDQLPAQVEAAFEIDTAIGVQLDVIGEYVGISRSGFDFSGPVTLNDTDYRQLIRIKIVQNNFGSSLATIQDFLNRFFAGTIFVFDFRSMRIGYFLNSGSLSLELAQFFIRAGLLPKPMGVQLSATIYGPVLTEFFGMRTYDYASVNSNPFNDYSDYQTDWPWLSYADAV